VPELQRLHAGHAPAVLAFELANRAYFAASISDRGDEFFDQFTNRHAASDPAHLGGKPGTWYQRDLAAD
jgi:[ribosomal protein S5]-alanine N-acetyltransferase